MACIYGSWTNHCAFSAQKTPFEEADSIIIPAVLEGKDGAAQTGLYKLAGGAAGSATAASHTFEHIRLNFYQSGKFLLVYVVQIDSGTWI